MNNALKITGLVFLCLVWGINWVAIKISLEGFPPMTSAALRFLLASVVMLLYVKWKRLPIKVTRREFWLLAITALLVYALDYGLIFWGEQYLSAGVTSIFFSTFALFTAIFSNFVFKNEAFSWNKFIGLTAGFAGILLVFYDQLAGTRFNLMVILASGAIVIAAVCAAAATVIVKKYISGMNPVRLSFHQTWMGAFFLLLIAAATENPGQIQLSTRAVLAMLYMGIAASAAAFVVYYRLLKEMSAVSLSFIIYVIPLVALLADFILLNEVIPLRSLVGMVIIFSGIWLSRGKRSRQSS
ncbi:MAG: DMT family transporter [bacterium]|nr:DMT family transporter [bacterium]